MMLADSKVSHLTPLLEEETQFFPAIPFTASHFIFVEQSGSILFSLPATNEEKQAIIVQQIV